MKTGQDTPNSSDGICIDLIFREDIADEWSETCDRNLEDIIQFNPESGIKSIYFQVSSSYQPNSHIPQDSVAFLNNFGNPIPGIHFGTNLNKLLDYIQLFYLSALRDSKEEFSPRSQYWSKILKNLKISEDERNRLNKELTRLNNELIAADPRLADVIAHLDQTQTVMGWPDKKTVIHALPMRPWDLLSRSEIVITGEQDDLNLPLSLHGQGTKSLSVLFLFQAYIIHLLKEAYKTDTRAILALEEPEAHHHPQTIRSLTYHLSEQESQMIISTHSPYFIKDIPLQSIRMFRRNGPETCILSANIDKQRRKTISAPNIRGIIPFSQHSDNRLEYDPETETLTVNTRLDQKTLNDLIKLYKEYPGIQGPVA